MATRILFGVRPPGVGKCPCSAHVPLLCRSRSGTAPESDGPRFREISPAICPSVACCDVVGCGRAWPPTPSRFVMAGTMGMDTEAVGCVGFGVVTSLGPRSRSDVGPTIRGSECPSIGWCNGSHRRGGVCPRGGTDNGGGPSVQAAPVVGRTSGCDGVPPVARFATHAPTSSTSARYADWAR